jgi:pyruvate-formate lyase
MTYAAKNGEVYHLWWHPHNFGKNQDQNFKNLKEILDHFASLKNEYGMKSLNMNEVASHT